MWNNEYIHGESKHQFSFVRPYFSEIKLPLKQINRCAIKFTYNAHF